MNASGDLPGIALNQAVAPPDGGRGMSVGWNFTLANGVTSGPVASLRSEVISTAPRAARQTTLCEYAWLAYGLSGAMGRPSVGAGELQPAALFGSDWP